jgi:D-beta-D-heptose 7-phosphate kinase/D-beta-D-heptose 1-phosphate adenosyltransferase
MRKADIISTRVCTLHEALYKLGQWRVTGKTVAFTNGVFDILHRGHIFSLSQAAAEADFLVVGLNSDASTKRLKGDSRPVNDEQSRALVLAALLMVDMVVIFEEDTPLNLITTLQPDVLVKGGDYTLEQIVGAKEVMAAGGKVIINPIVEGFSTTGIIQKMSS